MPIISVIVPVYNAEKYLHRCIDSILAQTFTNFELLLINDGSKDNSGKICDEYAVKDQRIRVFHKENGGVSSARNIGLDNAQGRWIAFADSDDWICENMYEIMLKKLDSCKADLCICDINMYWGGAITDLAYEHCLSVTGDRIEIVRRYINCSWNCCYNIIAKKELYERYSLRFPNGIAYCEDFQLTLRLLFFANKIVKVREALYIYDRTNETSAMHELNSKKQNDRCWCDMSIISFFKQNGVYDLYREAMSFRILAYTQEWVLDKERWSEFLQYYPESHKYLRSCNKIIAWRKILMWCIIHRFFCMARIIIGLKNISRKLRNA